jgi:hypothetical protein
MYKYTSELRADELGTNETPNVMTVGVENYGHRVWTITKKDHYTVLHFGMCHAAE